jgi:hypothetical protein
MGWVVKGTPRPLYPREIHPVPIVLEAGWAPGPVWTGAKNLAPTGSFFLNSLLLSLYFICTYLLVLIFVALAFCPYSTTHTTQTSMPSAGFEPVISAGERTQT